MSSVNIHNEWGELKEIIVGNCYNISEYNVDLSFKLFFLKNISSSLIKKSIKLQSRFVEQRQEDLDNLSDLLKSHNIIVKRPQKLETVKKFETPYFSDYLCPVDNPRDQNLIIGNEIIETPCQWRRRYFENDLMKDIFKEYFLGGSKWTIAPRPTLQDEAFDFSNMSWEENPELKDLKNDPSKFEIMFDGAQCLKFGRDIVMNGSTKNHELGHRWLSNHLGNDYKVHYISITDHHIDGMFMPLCPGVLLINPNSMKNQIEKLPSALQKWKMIQVPEEHSENIVYNAPLFASANINVNVLPISEKQVMIFNPDGNKKTELSMLLEQNGFEVIVAQLRHSRMFGGGLHCATLDTVRKGLLESYF